MNVQIIKPSGYLKNFVKQYSIMETDKLDGNVSELVIPIENIQLIFHYKNPFIINNNTTEKQPLSMISGLTNTSFQATTYGEAGAIFVSFLPAGACFFFHFPLFELKNQNIDLKDIFNNEIRIVEEQLSKIQSVKSRINIIEKFLYSKFSTIDKVDFLHVKYIVDLIKMSKGQINGKEISKQLFLTSKTLERKFMHYIGFSTKQYTRIIRFQCILQDLQNPDMSLTQCALKNGYFDQAHFIKDFKMISGYTPKEFKSKYVDCFRKP